VLAAFAGTLRTNGWMAILTYVLFGLGYALLLFLKRGTKE
jgi:hypothetical protein